MYKKSTLWALIALLTLTLMGSAPAMFACEDEGGEGIEGLATGDGEISDPRDSKLGCSADPYGRVLVEQLAVDANGMADPRGNQLAWL